MFIQSRMASSEIHNIRTSSMPSVKRTLSCTRVPGIQGHSRSSFWCRHKSRTLCRRCADDISETYEDIAKRKLQIRRFQRPHPGLKTLLQETPSNICKWFILPETRRIDVHYFDSMGRCLLVSRNYLWKPNLLSLKLFVRKPTLAWNSHSRSFYFAISYRPTRGNISHIILLALSLKIPKK